jgi:hypothetical protein
MTTPKTPALTDLTPAMRDGLLTLRRMAGRPAHVTLSALMRRGLVHLRNHGEPLRLTAAGRALADEAHAHVERVVQPAHVVTCMCDRCRDDDNVTDARPVLEGPAPAHRGISNDLGDALVALQVRVDAARDALGEAYAALARARKGASSSAELRAVRDARATADAASARYTEAQECLAAVERCR